MARFLSFFRKAVTQEYLPAETIEVEDDLLDLYKEVGDELDEIHLITVRAEGQKIYLYKKYKANVELMAVATLNGEVLNWSPEWDPKEYLKFFPLENTSRH